MMDEKTRFEESPRERIPEFNEDPPVVRKDRPRHGRGITLPVILIGAGIALLLKELGILSFDWQTILGLSPVLLILLGLDIILGRRSPAASAGLAVASLVLIVGMLWFSSLTRHVQTVDSTVERGVFVGEIEENTTGETNIPLDDEDALDVTLDLNMMAVDIGGGEPGIIGGSYNASAAITPDIYYESGSTGELVISQRHRIGPGRFRGDQHLFLELPPDIPIDLTVNANLGDVTLDLADLTIRTLEVESNSGAVTITLPDSGEIEEMTVLANLGEVIIEAPGGADLVINELSLIADVGSVSLALPAAGELGDVSISADLGAVDVSLAGDARDINMMGTLDIRCDTGSIDLELPGRGRYDVFVQADLGSVTLIVPENLAASVEFDSDLGSMTVDSGRFTQIDDNTWETAGYSQADDRAEVTIESSLGSATLTE